MNLRLPGYDGLSELSASGLGLEDTQASEEVVLTSLGV